MTVDADGALSETVYEAFVLASVTGEGPLIASVGVTSSSLIVVVTAAVSIVPRIGFEIVTVKGSFGSSAESSFAWTVNVAPPVPSGTVSVPGVIVKSDELVVPPGAALNCTVPSSSVPSVSVTL